MITPTKPIRFAVVTFLIAFSVTPTPSFCATSVQPPAFVEESVSDFISAARHEARTESVQHLDPSKYRAFRYMNRDRVLIGAAQSISVTAGGSIDIVPLLGTSVTVRRNTTHQTFSHLALPRDGRISASLLQRVR